MYRTQIRFFSPLRINDDDGYTIDLTADEKLKLLDVIETRLAVFQLDTEFSLAKALHHLSNERRTHVSDITQHVAVREGNVYICFVVTINQVLCSGIPKPPYSGEPIKPYIDEIKDDLDAQISDGWGENFVMQLNKDNWKEPITDDSKVIRITPASISFAEVNGLAYDAKRNPHYSIVIVLSSDFPDPYNGKLFDEGFIIGHSRERRHKYDMYYNVWEPLVADEHWVTEARRSFDTQSERLQRWYGISSEFSKNLAMHTKVFLGEKSATNKAVKQVADYIKEQ